MSPEQQKQLIEIRKRKQELLLEIQVSNDHIMYKNSKNFCLCFAHKLVSIAINILNVWFCLYL